ncbi:MAG: glycosyltransferase [Muribaculaceae bacterium]|nr:glycosyltransferase [Muribaculaceae bacterium]
MTLDILIPTYNRSRFLIKNLEHLRGIISNSLPDDIKIIICDNASTDNTQEAVADYVRKNSITNITYHRQSENVGFNRNLISSLSLSNAQYVLTLGDDDFIDERYLKKAIEAIKRDPSIAIVLPSFEAIDETGNSMGWGRDLGLTTLLFSPSVKTAKVNSVRAHQISGIILKREGLTDALKKGSITNLYPQIFLAAYCCLKGKCLHITEYPVLVTQTKNKAWRYDDVGLLTDIFENYKALHLNAINQFAFEHEMIKQQRWRAFKYFKRPTKQINVIFKIAFGKNTSSVGKILLPLYLAYLWMRVIAYAINNRLKGCRQ